MWGTLAMNHRSTSAMLCILAVIASFRTHAATPTIDSLNVQGYMKKANGQTVTDGSYYLAFGIMQNGTARWCKIVSTAITNGLFSKTLSGVGSDCTGLPSGTSLNGINSSATTLNTAIFTGGTAGGVTIRIYASSAIDGTNPQFDVAMSAVPTAWISAVAKSVEDGSITVASVATSAKATASAGVADAGKFVLLDSSGKLDSSLLPSVVAASGSNSNITALTGLTTALSVAQGGTGSATAAGARSALSAAQSGANSDITSLTALSTPLTIAQGGTGGTTATAALTGLGAASPTVVNTWTAAQTFQNLVLSSDTLTTVAATTYNDATPYVYTRPLYIVTSGGNHGVTFTCIDSANAVQGSILVILLNITAVTHTAANFIFTNAGTCTGTNSSIRTSTAANVVGATNNSSTYGVLVYDGSRWHLVASNL